MKKFIIAIALAAAAASSHAQMYVQGNLGSVYTTPDGFSTESKTTFGIGAGYQLSPNFAVDALYQRLYTDSSIQLKSNAIFVRAVGIYPISNVFSINAKLGVGQASFKDTLTGETGKGNITAGVGFDYAINKEMSIGLDVDFYSTKADGALPSTKNTNAALNLKYRF